MSKVVAQGFCCAQTFSRDPWLDSIRTEPDFAGIVAEAEPGRQAVAAAFLEAGGGRLLGVPPA